MQRRYNLTLIAAACITLMLGACHSVPKHARFIPKDALAVISVNTGSISKEVAWSKITGSKILDDMQNSARTAKDTAAVNGLKNIEQSGIDFMSTLYLYLKPDTRFSGSQRATLVLPVKDKGQWEAWIKKTWPAANIHAAGNRKEALLDGKWYAGWDGDVAMIMNTVMQPAAQTPAIIPADSVGTFNSDESLMPPPAPYNSFDEKADEAATAAEMATAFGLPKDAAITENKHFNSLVKEGHDVSFYLNYDAMMNSTAGLAGGAMGMSMGNTLYKGTAMTGGFDFEKGAVDGNMRYYTSDSLKEIAKEFGRDNFDGSMASRLPGQALNLAAGYHLSPKAVKMIMDKMGYTGLANMYLGSQGFTVDNILSAFTGDIAFSMNNFKMVKEMQGTDTASQALGMTPYESYSPKMDYLFAMKIGDKATFDRLFTFVNTQMGASLVQSAPNTYTIPHEAGSPATMMDNFMIVVSDKYLAAGNNAAVVQAFIKGSGTITDAARKEISGHPLGFYGDAQSMMQAAIFPGNTSPSDSAAFAAAKKLFADFSMKGGEYKDGANEYHYTLHMLNKSENSLLQLVQFAQRVAALKRTEQNSPI